MNWTEGAEFISFSYPYLGEDRHGQVLYLKTTGNFKLIDHIQFEKQGIVFRLPIPQDIQEDSFVGVVVADQIEQIPNNNSQAKKSFGASSKILDFSINESDNPIVVVVVYHPF